MKGVVVVVRPKQAGLDGFLQFANPNEASYKDEAQFL